MINPTDYINAVISQSFKDEYLRPVYREGTNLAHFESGQMAFVFKLYSEDTGKYYAAKLYSDPDRLEYGRIKAIERYIRNLSSDYFVDYSFEGDFIYVDQDGLSEDEKVKPAVLMEWIDGRTLGEVVKELCYKKDYENLSMLAEKFRELALFLLDKGFAHGDLKHDNIIVDESFNLNLIDYDGMFIPEFASQKSPELGTRAFQHPKRTANDFDRNLDDFSILIIYTSLTILSKYPDLYGQYEGSENLLFRYEDFLQPNTSKLFRFLKFENTYASLIASIKDILNKNCIYIENVVELLTSKLNGDDNKRILTGKVDSSYWQLKNGGPSNPATQEYVFDDSVQDLHYRQKKRIKEFLTKMGTGRSNFTKSLLSSYYPIKETLIQQFPEIIEWEELSRSSSIPWTVSLLEKYKNKWDWRRLSANKFLPWSEFLVEKFKDRWEWNVLSLSRSLPWSESFIKKYENKWDWEKLSFNESIPWTEHLIEEYKDKWDWKELSKNYFLPWTEHLIEKFKNKWYWGEYGLNFNQSLPWSEFLVEKFKDRWEWNDLSRNGSFPWSGSFIKKYEDKWDWSILSLNESLPWTEHLIEKYRYMWDWVGLSLNESLPWTEHLIEKFKDKWDWRCLSKNESIPWTEYLIEKYKDKWTWVLLSINASLPWSETLIERYIDKWNWGENGLSNNKSLPWTESFIKKYEDYWNWDKLSGNASLPWTESFIEKYKDKWLWRGKQNSWHFPGLQSIRSLPWSVSFIEKYKDKWDWEELSYNKSLYDKAFAPYLDDELVEEIFENIDEFRD